MSPRTMAVDTDASGALLRRGASVRKVRSELGDARPNGALGVVRGSVGPINIGDGHGNVYVYCVAWASAPGVPVMVVGWKLEPAEVA